MKKLFITIACIAVAAAVMTGCTQADRARHNVQKEANAFNVERRLTVINARTDKPLLEITGRLSISNNADNELVVTVETAPDEYRVNYVFLNEWTLYVVEDVSGADVDPYHYEINFLPEMIVPFTVTSND